MVQRVQSSVKDRFLFLGCDQKNLDGLILVSGCPRACAKKNLDQKEILLRSIIEETEFESLIEWLSTLDGSGEI